MLLRSLTLCVLTGVVLAASEKPVTVRLFLFTAATEGGLMDDAAKARAKATEELRKALKGKARVALVEDRVQAQVVVEVLSRQKEATGDYNPTWYGGAKGQKNMTVRVRLSAGDYSTEIVGDTSAGRHQRAAGEAASRIDQWLKDNASRLTVP